MDRCSKSVVPFSYPVGTEIQIKSCFDEDVFDELDDLQGEDVLAHVVSNLDDTGLQCKHTAVSMVCQQTPVC